VELEFKVDVSDEFVTDHIQRLGTEPPKRWAIEFDLEEQPPHLRALLLEAHQRYLAVEPFPTVREPTDDPDLFLSMVVPWLETVETQEAKEKQEKEEEELERQAAQERFNTEMQWWVAENGSPRLRAAVEGGYRSNTTYAIERAASELPGFWIDTAGDIEWGQRTDPSIEALDLVQAVQERAIRPLNLHLDPRIIWLTEAPRALDQYLEEKEEEEGFEPQEAILVEGYLGRYDAVLPVDSALHRESEIEVW
jgi:hypothetical protein